MRRIVTDSGPDPVDQFVGARITERRLGLGLRQTDLAKALGLTFQQVQKYEKGTNRVSSSKLWATARYLGVGIEYFFEGLPSEAECTDRDAVSPPVVPPTKLSLEIERMSRQLSVQQQRTILTLVSSMAEARA